MHSTCKQIFCTFYFARRSFSAAVAFWQFDLQVRCVIEVRFRTSISCICHRNFNFQTSDAQCLKISLTFPPKRKFEFFMPKINIRWTFKMRHFRVILIYCVMDWWWPREWWWSLLKIKFAMDIWGKRQNGHKKRIKCNIWTELSYFVLSAKEIFIEH